MNKIVCLYYSRTGKTKKIIETIASKLEGEIVEYTDGENRGGIFGYIKACIECIFNSKVKINEVKSQKPLNEYDAIIIGTPIWVEDCSIICKEFLKKYKDELPENIYFVVTHMCDNEYKNKIIKLNKYLNVESKGFISICSEKILNDSQIDGFISKVLDDIKRKEL